MRKYEAGNTYINLQSMQTSLYLKYKEEFIKEKFLKGINAKKKKIRLDKYFRKYEVRVLK